MGKDREGNSYNPGESRIMKISLAMVVKNEETTLRRAIESVLGIVDEAIVYVDSKTEDKTRQVLFEMDHMDGQVCEFDWTDDFAAARNKAIEHCKGDWIIYLDGHQYLEPGATELLKKEIEEVHKDTEALFTPVTWLSDDGVPKLVVREVRAFRKHVRYSGKVHCHIVADGQKYLPDVKVVHARGTQPAKYRTARNKQRSEMMIKELKKRLLKDPNDSRARFYLANTYRDNGDTELATHWYENYLVCSTTREEKIQASIYLAELYVKNKTEDATNVTKEVLLESLKDGDTRAEVFEMLGDIASDEKNYHSAAAWYGHACATRHSEGFIFVDPEAYHARPLDKLSMSFDHLGMYREALASGQMALNEYKEYYRNCIDKGHDKLARIANNIKEWEKVLGLHDGKTK